jgi:hypothetical protein
VSADGDNLVVTNTFNGSVQLLDPATGEILQDVRTVALPINAIRHDDRIVAAQAGGGNVVNIDDPEDVLIGELGLPTGLASDGTTLYVSDWATGNVWAVDEAGPRVVVEGLAQPEGLAVDGDRLLVVETGAQQVTAIDLATASDRTGDHRARLLGDPGPGLPAERCPVGRGDRSRRGDLRLRRRDEQPLPIRALIRDRVCCLATPPVTNTTVRQPTGRMSLRRPSSGRNQPVRAARPSRSIGLARARVAASRTVRGRGAEPSTRGRGTVSESANRSMARAATRPMRRAYSGYRVILDDGT